MPRAALATAVNRFYKTLKDTQLRPYQLDEQRLIHKARRRTGYTDFGEDFSLEGFRVLLHACREEANLSFIGRFCLYQETVRILSHLLEIQAAIARCPDIAERPVRQPLFIMGLPRSGTTFLHRLLAEDPANHVPRCWQILYPSPPAESFTTVQDRRIKRAKFELGVMRALAPQYKNVHPIDALVPQECTEILGHTFASSRFDALYRVPSYRRWLESIGFHGNVYRFHKRFLQYLQYRAGPGQWILKAPEHVFAIDAIRRVYPDARIVFSHRDPLKVIPSVARLTEIMRRPFSRGVDPVDIGEQLFDRWVNGSKIMMETAKQQASLSQPIFHVNHLDLVQDPVQTVKRLYEHFGMPLGEKAEARIKRFAKQHANGDYGSPRYTFERYGLVPGALRRRFDAYMAFFNVQPEVEIE